MVLQATPGGCLVYWLTMYDVNWLRRGNKDFQAYLYNVAGDEEDSVSFERPKISTNELARLGKRYR